VVVTRTSARRSSALSATGYFFCEDTAPLSNRTETTRRACPTPPARTTLSRGNLLGIRSDGWCPFSEQAVVNSVTRGAADR
jgi:hypothetical protein